MKLSDTHCHLDLYPDPASIVADIEMHRIRTIAVTNAPSVYRRSAQITDGYPYLRTALGFHPQLAAIRRGELALFRELAPSTRYIGEVGLDFVTLDAKDRRAQQDIFRGVLDVCASGGKLLTVHSRRAAAETIAAIGDRFASEVILHWYTGDLRLIERAAAYGFFFSVNTAMARSERGRRVVAAIPRERVLFESDGPFVRLGNKAAVPSDGEEVAQGLAKLWRMDAEDVATTVDLNFRTALRAGSLRDSSRRSVVDGPVREAGW
jgi:TatD DNase family protein